jgi:hypothetical protein
MGSRIPGLNGIALSDNNNNTTTAINTVVNERMEKRPREESHLELIMKDLNVVRDQNKKHGQIIEDAIQFVSAHAKSIEVQKQAEINNKTAAFQRYNLMVDAIKNGKPIPEESRLPLLEVISAHVKALECTSNLMEGKNGLEGIPSSKERKV